MKIFAAFGALALLGGTVAVLYGLPAPASAPEAPLRTEKASASVLFVGDMFFDRYIRTVSETAGQDFIFSCVYPWIAEADLTVGNLEGPITPSPSVSLGTEPGSPMNFTFTFPPETAATLARNGIDAVSLGNNHISNFGLDGIAETRAYLDAAGVSYFGGTLGDEPVYRTFVSGIPFSFIAYNEFGGDSPEKVADKISAEKAEGRTTIVFAHWGDEYATTTERVKNAARLFAFRGADAVIGSHPHIVQEHEYIGNTLVYYSLGNFIFDQYWNEDVSRGLAVLIHFSPAKDARASATEYPVILTRDGRTCLTLPQTQAPQ
jgi:poly-gamma-glutamate synthesis protein (capsule biosynthesis protein)